MTDRIDHAALAAQMARDALSTSRSGAQVIAGMLAATAQVHATLALVEQAHPAELAPGRVQSHVVEEARGAPCGQAGDGQVDQCGEQVRHALGTHAARQRAQVRAHPVGVGAALHDGLRAHGGERQRKSGHRIRHDGPGLEAPAKRGQLRQA